MHSFQESWVAFARLHGMADDRGRSHLGQALKTLQYLCMVINLFNAVPAIIRFDPAAGWAPGQPVEPDSICLKVNAASPEDYKK
ncbi:hypothetical protein JR316_0005752 [Psilocybe cubensis]|uniref:Uncharacterized protein n=1 Tax=Psilocybe cubensis TaxID=181762 RepID=A0ACB8H067_PSICU|nr:hypothetical protein JR316_0005752 [Psilocybe cubensis]KAH9481231.1 hypothetical protein JR316_0005752 [Psilocybe cubensis]